MDKLLSEIENLSFKKKMLAIAVAPVFCLVVIAAETLIIGSNTPFAGLLCLALSSFVIYRLTRHEVEVSEKAKAAAQTLAQGGNYKPIIGAGANSEIGLALNEIHENAEAERVSQRERIKQGITEIVVNLARRNQSLLDRQVEVLDELERSEENPETLEQLFVVDHLATRMRRNSESLLVLADGEAPKRRGNPVAVSDVLRVAVGEVENYQNLDVQTETDAMVSAGSAVDLAHLLAELIENASHFSPPDQRVQIVGKFTIDQDYVINVIDHGTGMSEAQLELSNDILDNPPELDLGLSRSLGFSVIGRLAKRLGMKATLHDTPGSGVSAVVRIPQSLLVGEDSERAAPEASAEESAPTPTHREPEQSANPRANLESDTTATLAALKGLGSEILESGVADGKTAAEPTKVVKSEEKLASRRSSDAKPSEAKTEDKPTMAPPAEAPAAKSDGVPDALKPAGSKPSDSLSESVETPKKLEEAVPTGEAFEKGLDELLEAPAKLTKRKRGESAPISEGRQIGESETAAKASSRKPEEIRLMLSRYRDGIKGSGDKAEDAE